MCLNCGCNMADDTMGDARNIVLDTLAKAAIAGNDSKAKDLIDEMIKQLQRLRPEELQKRIDELKAKGQDK